MMSLVLLSGWEILFFISLETRSEIGGIHPQEVKVPIYLGKVFFDECLLTQTDGLLLSHIGDKKADAPLIIDDLLLLQELIGAHDRIGIDLQLDGQFPDRRYACGGRPFSEQHLLAHIVCDL